MKGSNYLIGLLWRLSEIIHVGAICKDLFKQLSVMTDKVISKISSILLSKSRYLEAHTLLGKAFQFSPLETCLFKE